MEVKKSKKANLENKKVLFREIGFVATLLVLLLAFEWSSTERYSAALEDDRTLIEEEEIISVELNEPPPPPPPPRAPEITDDIEIVDDEVKLPDIIVASAEDDANMGVEITDYMAPVEQEATVVDDIPFAVVEDKPSFMGGDENEFSKWVGRNLTYPESAKENNVQGRVMVEFVVTAQGDVTNVKILRGVDPALDKEAVEVIKKSPKWTPGRQRGKPVRVKYMFPVVFQLR